MLEAGIVFSIEKTDPVQRNRWLADHGQWGIPGSSLNAEACRIICATIEHLKGKPVLEIGTSRGHLTGMMAEAGCKLTTIDHVDRGAKQNLHGLNVNVVIADAAEFLESTDQQFDAIVCDLHGNTPDDWKRISASLLSALRSHGLLITNNAELYKFSEWSGETGVKWFIEQLSSAWKVNLLPHPAPGLAIIQKP